MPDIKEVYKSKIIDALTSICVDAYTSGFNEGLKTGTEIQNSKCSNIEPFDYDNDEYTGRIAGKNDSAQEYKSDINKDLGILGE